MIKFRDIETTIPDLNEIYLFLSNKEYKEIIRRTKMHKDFGVTKRKLFNDSNITITAFLNRKNNEKFLMVYANDGINKKEYKLNLKKKEEEGALRLLCLYDNHIPEKGDWY